MPDTSNPHPKQEIPWGSIWTAIGVICTLLLLFGFNYDRISANVRSLFSNDTKQECPVGQHYVKAMDKCIRN